MEKKVASRLVSIYIAVCCIVSASLFAISDDRVGIIIATFPLIAAAFTFVWLKLYKRDRAIRIRSAIGFFSIISLVPITFMLLFVFVFAPLHSCNGGVVEMGAEPDVIESSVYDESLFFTDIRENETRPQFSR